MTRGTALGIVLGVSVGSAAGTAVYTQVMRLGSWANESKRPADMVMVMVAARDLPPFAVVSERDLFAVQIEPQYLHAGVFLSPVDVLGRQVVEPIFANELVPAEAIGGHGPGGASPVDRWTKCADCAAEREGVAEWLRSLPRNPEYARYRANVLSDLPADPLRDTLIAEYRAEWVAALRAPDDGSDERAIAQAAAVTALATLCPREPPSGAWPADLPKVPNGPPRVGVGAPDWQSAAARAAAMPFVRACVARDEPR